MPSTPEGRTTLPCWWGGRCGRIQAEASGLSDLMAAPDLVILSTRVVTGEGIRPAAVAIADGVITAVHEHGGPPDAARQLDVGDAALLPGVVDTHVHVNEPGRTEWDGCEAGARAGAPPGPRRRRARASAPPAPASRGSGSPCGCPPRPPARSRARRRRAGATRAAMARISPHALEPPSSRPSS